MRKSKLGLVKILTLDSILSILAQRHRTRMHAHHAILVRADIAALDSFQPRRLAFGYSELDGAVGFELPDTDVSVFGHFEAVFVAQFEHFGGRACVGGEGEGEVGEEGEEGSGEHIGCWLGVLDVLWL